MDLDLASTKIHEDYTTELDTPPHTLHPIIKPLLSFPLKNHHIRRPPPPSPAAITYKECMKNHAAALGGHALDGCGEFMQPPQAAEGGCGRGASFKCAACGCHRNFHRRDQPEFPNVAAITPPFLDFRHPTLPVKRFSLSPPQVLFELNQAAPVTPTAEMGGGRNKRFRTKFSSEQKEKMRGFAAKVGWKMQKSDETAVREFCREIGVTRGVLKVWMHNNKNTFATKSNKDQILSMRNVIMNDGGLRTSDEDEGKMMVVENNGVDHRRRHSSNNGSSSSSP